MRADRAAVNVASVAAWEPKPDPDQHRRVLDEQFLENLEILRAFLRNPRDPRVRARHARAFLHPAPDDAPPNP